MSSHSNSSSGEEEEEDDFLDFGLSMISIAGPSKHDCGYCKGKDTSISFGIWAHSLTCSDYQDLIDRGWRRSGKYLYKPDLEKSCCPQYTIRLDASQFNTTKSQKKVLNKFNRYIKGTWDPNGTAAAEDQTDGKATATKPAAVVKPANYVQVKSLRDIIHESEIQEENKHKLKIELEPSSSTTEKFELYKKYQISVHHDKPDEVTERGFKRFLVDSPMKTEKNGDYGSFHQKYIMDGKLIALAVIDILPKCVSSVYFIYDPDYSFLALGKYSVFREISLVQEYHDRLPDLHYYYMGFYIHTCPKMNYKGQYAPSDLLDPVDYQWHPIEQSKKQLDSKSFVTFAKEEEKGEKKRDYPPGWLDPKSITEDDLDRVFVMASNDGTRLAPITYVVKFETSKVFRKSILDYVASVGLDLAHKLIIC